MKRRIFAVFFLFFVQNAFSQQPDYDLAVIDYVMTYNQFAVREMNIYRIPASITLAQGIIESNAGRSRLAVEGNNHFGIKCHKDWQGDTIIEDDETPNECFRKYSNPEESFRDHSWFLSQRDRYKFLFDLDITNYKGWALGLKIAGYATNPDYPEKLIKTIETYRLYRYDNPDYREIPAPDTIRITRDSIIAEKKETKFEELRPGPSKHIVYTNNNLSLTIALEGDTWQGLSELFFISVRKLYKFNDLKKGARLSPGQIVYLEKKRSMGAAGFHIVQSGETMYSIAQNNGIRLKDLYSLNEMTAENKIKPGQKLFLR
jgi:hypothetical protein